MPSQTIERLTVAGTFTLDSVIDGLRFWRERLALPLDIQSSPYAQLLPELLNADSALRRPSRGRLLVVRLSDLAGAHDPARAADELAAALLKAADGTATCLILCPAPDMSGVEDAFAETVRDLPGLSVIRAARAFADHAVTAVFDPAGEAAAHIPYTAEALAVLATVAARWAWPLALPPIKLVACDGDETLWRGVVGEDGIDGVALDAGHVRLQKTLAEASKNGVIVTLASKNDEADVVDLFGARADFPLALSEVLAHRINWQPKPANVGAMAAEFGVGGNAILFLDDNPVEIAAMRAALPEAISVHMPKGAGLEAFLRHLWPLDPRPVTRADQQRALTYKAERSRQAARQSAADLDAFFAGLGLTIDVARADAGDATRLAQMTQRTNQFNATLLRLDDAGIHRALADPETVLLKVSVADRFGDYGIVGMIRARFERDLLAADIFLLSCRALGRGVEHEMIRTLAAHAESAGCGAIAIEHVTGPRNTPVRRFLAGLSDAALPEQGRLVLGTAAAGRVVFKPTEARPAEDEPPAGKDGAAAAAESGAQAVDRGAVFTWIAADMTTGAAILAAMRGAVRPRPDLNTAYLAPSAGRETAIAEIWAEVLGFEQIGAADPFRDLGGRSLELVRVHGLLSRRLGLEIDIADLFRFATVRALAAHLAASAASAAEQNALIQANAARAALRKHAISHVAARRRKRAAARSA